MFLKVSLVGDIIVNFYLSLVCTVAKKSGMEDGSLKDENLSASSSYSK